MLLSIYAKPRTANYANTAVRDSEEQMCMPTQLMCRIKSEVNYWLKASSYQLPCHAPRNVGNVILPFHVITGSDHPSGWYGHENKPQSQKLMKDPGARQLLGQVGRSLELKDEVKAYIRAFILSKVYGRDIGLTCGHARASKGQKLKTEECSSSPTWWWHSEPPLCTDKLHDILLALLHFDGSSEPNWQWLGNYCKYQPVHYTLPPLPKQVTAHEHLLNSSDEGVVMMRGGRENQQIQSSKMHNFNFKDQNDASLSNWQQILIVWSKIPQNP